MVNDMYYGYIGYPRYERKKKIVKIHEEDYLYVTKHAGYNK